MIYKKITFEEVFPVWNEKLWLNRKSPIESHSAMAWPFEGLVDEYDMSIFDYPATFIGAYDNNKLVGVNSGHKTSDLHYRSRGLWVDPEYRRQGIAQMLFALLENQAVVEQTEMMWSLPRKSALTAYQHFGFRTVGDYIGTETSDANIYAIKRL